MDLLLEAVFLRLDRVQLPEVLLLGGGLNLLVLVEEGDLGVELALLLLQEDVAGRLLLQEQLGVVQLAVDLLGFPLPLSNDLPLFVNLLIGIVKLQNYIELNIFL